MSHYGPSSPPPGYPGPHHGGSYGWNPQDEYAGQSPYPQPGNMPYMPVAQPGTLPLRPLTLGDYFSSMFTTLRKSPGLFFGAALIFGSLAAIFGATGEFFLTRTLSTSMMDPYAQLDSIFSNAGTGFFVSMFLSQIVMILGQTFNWGMYSIMVMRGAIGMKTTLSQGFRLLRGQWGRLIGLLFLIAAGFIALGLIFALLVFLFAAVMFSGGEPQGSAAIVLGILGALAMFLIPTVIGMYFLIRWYLVVPAMVIEDIGVFAALRRSWQLTRGHFWRTLGITLLFWIILGVVSSVIVSPFSFVTAFIVTSVGTEAQLSTAMLVTNLIVTAVSSLITFVVSNMGLLVAIFFYLDYRFRKEGLGLEFQQLAVQHASGSSTDRFDTSLEQQPNSTDEENDLIPGRHSTGLRQGPPPGYGQAGPYGQQGFYPGPYGQQPPYPGPPPQQGPPPPPGSYR